MSKRQLLLLSSGMLHGYKMFEFASEDLKKFMQKNNVKKILFIPYALKKHDDYLNKIQKDLEPYDLQVEGIHTFENPVEAVKKAQAIYIGGGNTFVLLKTLYEKKLIEAIRKRVLVDGIPYMGSSAGSNVATVSICTTNDMPITYPPSFDAMKLVPFNINPHYQDPEPDSKHKGETREERIQQYHEQAVSYPVLGLREGTGLLVDGDKATLIGVKTAKLFVKNKEPEEFEPGADFSFLLQTPEITG